MLPPKLSSEICSITPDQDRQTISVVFHVNPHSGTVTDGDVWIGQGIVKSAGKLSLGQIDDALSDKHASHQDVADAKDIRTLNVSGDWLCKSCEPPC